MKTSMGLEVLVVTRRRTVSRVNHCFVILSEGSYVKTDFLSEFPPNIVSQKTYFTILEM